MASVSTVANSGAGELRPGVAITGDRDGPGKVWVAAGRSFRDGSGRSRQGRVHVTLLLAALLATFGGAALAGSEVVRVRLPAKDVSRFFPPGTGLRVLSPREFEARVEAANREPAARRAAEAPRLLRARHRARWENGLLRGRSELLVSAGPSGPVEFPLEPWTPAILIEAGAAPAVGARDSGAAVLRIAASPREQVLGIDWEQQPRPHSRGFSLGLPAVDTTVLELELPRGWTASGQRGVRRGPMPTGDPSLSLWEIDGDAGRFDVELRDANDRGWAAAGAGAWMTTTTEVALRRTADLVGSMVNWTADARLELDPRHGGRLEAQLDEGLELIDVQGDAVQGYHTDRNRSGTRVAVALAEGVRTTSLRFLAHAAVPPEGAWSVPAIRPLDATWTGGRTTVILDELHAVRELRERAGRLVPAGPGDAAAADRLTFEARLPRSVAELDFIRPRAELACTVRGHLVIGGTPARLDCRLDWSLHRGTVSQLEVDLSPGWLPDQVAIQGLDDPLSWHTSPLAAGATRLRVMLPASALAVGRWTLTLSATSNAWSSRGPLELPRVHPVGAAVVDEAWLAWGEDRATVQPVSAHGLAWIDPAEVAGLVTPPPSPELRQSLAWRWTAENAGARVDRERIDQEPSASIRARARIAPDGRRLAVEGTLVVGSGAAAMDALPLWVDAPGDPLRSWTFQGENGGALRLRPLDAAARARLDLAADASARALVLELPRHGQKAVSFSASLPWSSPGPIPLLFAPREYLRRGTIRVETPAGMKSHVRTDGLGRIHPSSAEAKLAPVLDEADRPDNGGTRDRAVQVFSYAEPRARLELTAEPMPAAPMPGVVREALLTTSWDGRGRTLNRLRLLVQHGLSASLSFELPEGATIVRVLRDGTDVAPLRSGRRLSMPAPVAGVGARTSSVVIDYTVDDVTASDGAILRPDRPSLDLPCLSFTWEVAAPPGWHVGDPGQGLVADDPEDPAGWPGGALGLGWTGWPSPVRRREADLADLTTALDGRLGRPAPEDLTFAEWFSRWDAGPTPVLVDRLALGLAGLGPRSSCSPGRLPADRRDSARALLQQQGLAIVPFPDALLITTESDRPRFEPQGPWRDAIVEALAWGSDRADRFQSVGRWRGETAPRASATAEPAGGGNGLPPGRKTWRFSASGWPGADGFVHLVDGRRRALSGWIVAGLLAIAWMAAPGRAARRRLLLPAAAAAACLLLDRILPARHGALTAGGFVGSLGILVAELAMRCRRSPAAPSAPARTESTLVRAATGPALLLAIALALGSLGAALGGTDAPIVALFPYEGPFDPARPPDRVILRLDDFRRLTRGATDIAASRPTVTAVASAHRVSRKSGTEILVETEIELAARGPGPFEWRVPVASAREISATLGGEPVPIAVEPGGRTARVVLPGAGNYLLSLRRWASARGEEAGAGVLSLPINATPSARLIVAPPADGVPQGVAVTRGRMERRPDGSLDGRLGPCDRIVVRWTRDGRDAVPREVGPVEGLILWDVTPAGDRVRAHLTYHRDEEIASVRLAHDPGVVLRSVSAPGRDRVYCEEDSESGEWLLSFDPPLPSVARISLDCWQPTAEAAQAPPAPEAGKAPPAPDAGSVVQSRRLPLVRPAGAERFTGVLGVRRPGDWTGRLVPIRDTLPIDDEAFVKAWGVLPEEPLTLCGTSRLGRDPVAELRTGPSSPRLLVRPAMQLRIESGRIVAVADADVEASSHFPITEAELPPGMQVTQVVGDGLIDWTASADRRLHLIWQRRESRSRRHVRILGWIPYDGNPLDVGPRRHRLPTPWVGWPGAEVGPGSLTVFSATRAEIRGATGLSPAPTPIAPEPAVAAAAVAGGASATLASGPRLSYMVEDPSRLGELSWDSRPPQVSVVVENQLAIDPDYARWIAVIRYDVLGGALDQMNLKIPAAWAGRANLSHAGGGRVSRAQVIGPSAFWSIAPDRPLWGSHRLVLRSTLPLGPTREIFFPEVAPLGKGSVDSYVGIVNATGHPLVAEDATGLQPILFASRFRDPEFDRDAGSPGGAYRVVKEPWALRVQAARAGLESPAAPDDAARVSAADVTVALMPDRSTRGRSLYEIRPDGGRLLTVELPDGSTILWASVGADPVAPMRAGPTSWSIALDPGRPEQPVCLIWNTPPPASGKPDPGGWTLPLPRAGPEPSPALVSVSAPDGFSIEGIPAGVEPVSTARLDLARADRLGRSIRGLLAELDRNSARDHERLVALLIDHELALRGARREAGRDASATARSPAEREIAGAIEPARTAIAEAVGAAGLDDDLASARDYLGLAQEAKNRPTGGVAERPAPCRIRTLGRPTAMVGILRGLKEPSARPDLNVSGAPRSGLLDDLAERSVLPAAALAAALIAATAFGARRSAAGAAIALALVLGAAALAGGPVVLAGSLIVAAAAFRHDRAAVAAEE